MFSTCGLRPACAALTRCGRQACVHKYVPRTFTPNIRSKRFIGVAALGDGQADAARCAGDEEGLAFEVHALVSVGMRFSAMKCASASPQVRYTGSPGWKPSLAMASAARLMSIGTCDTSGRVAA